MFETLIALFVWFATPVWLAVFLLIALWSEAFDCHKFAAFLSMTALGLSTYMLNINPMWLIGYIPVGLLWSMLRWRFHCSDVVKDMDNDNNLTSGTKHSKKPLIVRYKKRLDVKEQIDKIISWVFSWPISILSSVIGDIIRGVKYTVTNWLGSLYDKISNSATSKHKHLLEED